MYVFRTASLQVTLTGRLITANMLNAYIFHIYWQQLSAAVWSWVVSSKLIIPNILTY